MRVLFVSNNFPPEVNAPATRVFEHARQWVEDGHEVEVLTSAPNFPEGRVYDGYRNELNLSVHGGVGLIRVPTYIVPNEGTLKRIAAYVSFMVSAIWNSRHGRICPDVVVATSPQFFAALAGYAIARRLRVPFVLEIRDLWPASIVAVGAMPRNRIIRTLEAIERFLYRNADHVVVVTNSFVDHVTRNGADPERVSVIKNGVDLDNWSLPLDPEERRRIREENGWNGKFVAAYAGTIGMAHRADILLEAAQRCPDSDIAWVVIGEGAERKALEQRAAALNLPNFHLIDKQSKERIRYYMAEADAAVVHLRDTPLFRTVLPSKLFEAMASDTPILLGMRGEAKDLIEASGAGLAFQPEDPDGLVDVARKLKADNTLYKRIVQCGSAYVRAHHDRRMLARAYSQVLEEIVIRYSVPDEERRVLSAASHPARQA